ncbi:hypothetical protein BDP27DRAFT_1309961 [Rhodocollybia butyracea]|uniref:MYND-type domain-containing protein n=1 Tax=Rhodocollybia butyracea TaxID=206335 RepID=A0A9P5QAU9_9AGAR|nr:hypothetical protein BDP27DRAFT_1309961 [Rhodocollybia butyracea]
MSDFCSNCMKVLGRDNLRTCGQCRFVRYCSRGCQRAAWSTHKTTATIETLSKWINAWRMSLTSWSLWALAPNASEKDKLSTHCFTLRLEDLAEVGVLPRTRIYELLQEEDVAQHQIDNFVGDVRGDHTVQIVVFSPGFLRFVYFSIRDIADRQAKELDEVKIRIRDGVPLALQQSVEAGNLLGHKAYLTFIAAQAIADGVA